MDVHPSSREQRPKISGLEVGSGGSRIDYCLDGGGGGGGRGGVASGGSGVIIPSGRRGVKRIPPERF